MDIRITPGLVHSKPYPWQVPDWIEAAADQPFRIDDALIHLGIGHKQVMDDLIKRFPGEFVPESIYGVTDPNRAFLIRALKRWFMGVEVVEEEETRIKHEVPLYLFNCPKVKKAKTTYVESETSGGTVGWSIEVLGTGFGSDVSVSISWSNEFVASPGDRKLVFALLHIRIVKAVLYKWGEPCERFLKAELAESEVRDTNGIRTIDAREWRTLVGKGRGVERFDLSRDKSNDIATFSRSYELSGTFETNLGFKVFDLESSIKAKCTAMQRAKMIYTLPAGRLYELRAPTVIPGFYFDS